ncbi:MAG TPA: DUF1993 domain-containing protein [Burkholderiales bacterium]|nr:DUF1993 domain-containing protein [Burkholderiales bacterium]
MSLSMYQASAPRFANTLKNLSALLDKTQAHCEAKKIDPLAITSSRLFPDMFPFNRQIYIATDTAKGAVSRLAGIEIPKYEDTETTIPELKARLAKTIDFVMSVPAAKIEGSAEKDISMKIAGKDTVLKGAQYLLGHAYPNFYFHCTTAYNILRHNGVEIGKRDFLGTIVL